MNSFFAAGNSKQNLGFANVVHFSLSKQAKITLKSPFSLDLTPRRFIGRYGDTIYYSRGVWSDDTSRNINLGVIYEDAIIDIYLYNENNHDMELKNITAPSGVEISGLSVAGVLKADESREIKILVLFSGTVSVDDDIIFDFGTQTIKIHLKAVKVSVWAYRPIYAYSESKSLSTDIFTAQNGREVRRNLTPNATKKVYFKITSKEVETATGVKNLLNYAMKNQVLVPLWFSVTNTTAARNSTQKIPLNTLLREFKKGGYGLIWRGEYDYTLFEITNIEKSEISCKEAVSFAKGDLVLPLILATPNYNVEYSFRCDKVSSYEITFKELL